VLDLLLAAFGTSLLTGMRHATDPDHVVAVTTIVARERSVLRAALVGAQWGLGHTLTILVVGALIVGFKLTISPRLGLSMELAVAAMLVTLGVLNLVGTRGARGAHGHARPAAAGRTLPPFAVGTVHGLAGSAAATLFVTSLIPDPMWALAALGIFGAATVLGMTLVTVALALPSAYAAARMATLQRGLRIASGVASIAFGLWLAHQIGFEDGLFTATPRWTAH
jgi:hypothetical protein